MIVVLVGGGGVWLSVGRSEGKAIVVGEQRGFRYVIIFVTIIVIVIIVIVKVFLRITPVTYRQCTGQVVVVAKTHTRLQFGPVRRFTRLDKDSRPRAKTAYTTMTYLQKDM